MKGGDGPTGVFKYQERTNHAMANKGGPTICDAGKGIQWTQRSRSAIVCRLESAFHYVK